MSTLSLRGAAQVIRPPEDGLPFLRHDRAAELRLEPGSLTARDGRLTRLHMDGQLHAPAGSPDGERDDAGLAPVVEQLGAYFAGSREAFDVPLDRQVFTPTKFALDHNRFADVHHVPPKWLLGTRLARRRRCGSRRRRRSHRR